MKRRAMTLLEVVVAMALFSLLISSLCVWYSHFTRQNITYEKFAGPLRVERYFTERMQGIFSRVRLDTEKGVSLFCLHEGALIFTFDNGPRPRAELSHLVLAKLYLDPREERLCLTLWPQPKEGFFPSFPSETMILQEEVTSMSLKFFSPPDPFKKPVSPEQIGILPKEGWNTEWRKEYESLPALVNLQINGKKLYSFYLPKQLIYARSSS